MKFLYLVFAVFLLVSLAAPGYGQVRKHCPKEGTCSPKCRKAYTWSTSADCRHYCCLPPGWKGK
ncbi:cygnin-like [Phaenicophaeus curvirostris]|uniref:cygnin-like n=1 Tax=Phaenicophaeus curvirostris TaxID=33595 RepID=UPI0037F0F33B